MHSYKSPRPPRTPRSPRSNASSPRPPITLLNSFALKAAQRVQTDPATAAAARSGSLKASRRGSATSQSGAPPPPLMVDTADRASNIDTLAPPSAPSGAPKERTKTYVA